MCPDLLSKIRQEAINNKNLANCFDILGLQELTNFSASHVLLVKQKADIMEAIIGGTLHIFVRSVVNALQSLQKPQQHVTYKGMRSRQYLMSSLRTSLLVGRKNFSP